MFFYVKNRHLSNDIPCHFVFVPYARGCFFILCLVGVDFVMFVGRFAGRSASVSCSAPLVVCICPLFPYGIWCGGDLVLLYHIIEILC